MRVVIIGGGKLGCGYLVPLFVDAGAEVVLGCRSAQTASRAAAGWKVRVTGTGQPARTVTPQAAISTSDVELVEAVAEADLVVLSVGVGRVAEAAEQLVPGLAARSRPVDLWLIENANCTAPVRRALLRRAQALGVTLPPIGVAGAVATVAVGRGSWDQPGTPEFVGDRFRTLEVDATALRGPVPLLSGVRTTRQYLARLHEKLYVFNAGHALTAYLGWLRGHATLAEATADPYVRTIVAGALLEARRATLSGYPSLLRGGPLDVSRDVYQPVAEALDRYSDRELADPIARVARQPLRKLAPNDRLLGPVELMRRHFDRIPAHFALGVAAALLYGFGDDSVAAADDQAGRLRLMLSKLGVSAVLSSVCELPAGDPFGQAVAQRYQGFVFDDEDGVSFPPVAPGTPFTSRPQESSCTSVS